MAAGDFCEIYTEEASWDCKPLMFFALCLCDFWLLAFLYVLKEAPVCLFSSGAAYRHRVKLLRGHCEEPYRLPRDHVQDYQAGGGAG